MRLSCSAGDRSARCPDTILVNSAVNALAEIFAFPAAFDFFFGKTASNRIR